MEFLDFQKKAKALPIRMIMGAVKPYYLKSWEQEWPIVNLKDAKFILTSEKGRGREKNKTRVTGMKLEKWPCFSSSPTHLLSDLAGTEI